MKLVHLFGFIIKKFVTLHGHGHMNVKLTNFCISSIFIMLGTVKF